MGAPAHVAHLGGQSPGTQASPTHGNGWTRATREACVAPRRPSPDGHRQPAMHPPGGPWEARAALGTLRGHQALLQTLEAAAVQWFS